MSSDTRSLSPAQIESVRGLLPTFSRRDRLLWLLSYYCASRVHETLAVTIGDVFSDGKVRDFLRIERRNLKGGRGVHRRGVSSRIVPVHPVAAAAIRDYLDERASEAPLIPSAPLFASQKGGALTRGHAWRVFKAIYARAGIDGRGLGTHGTRRTAARALYEKSNHDLELVRAALNHRSIVSTQHYIRMSDCEAAKAFLSL